MKVYEVVPDTGEIYAISLIGDDDTPANGFTIDNGGFVALSESETYEVKMSASNDKLQIVYGIVLRPEQEILRKINGELAYMKFSSEVIREHSQRFLENGFQLNSTWNHEQDQKLKGISVVEQWIVRDDEGSSHGLKVQKGDWVVGMKLSDDVWNEYIESGRVKGFSIDSFIDLRKVSLKEEVKTYNDVKTNNDVIEDKETSKLEEIDLKNQIIKNKKSKMSIKSFINLFSSQPKQKVVINLASIEVDGVEFISDEDFAEGSLVYTIGENDEKLPVSEKTFEVDDFTVTTDVDGMIISKVSVDGETETEGDSNDGEEETTIEIETKKQKQTLSEGIGSYIELPVGEWTIGDTIYTVEAVTIPAEESYDGEEYTMNSIVKMVPVADSTQTELEKVKEELMKVKAEFSTRELELGSLQVNTQTKVDLSKMTPKERFRYFKNN